MRIFVKGFPAIFFGGENAPLIPMINHDVEYRLGMTLDGDPDSHLFRGFARYPGVVEVYQRDVVYVEREHYPTYRKMRQLNRKIEDIPGTYRIANVRLVYHFGVSYQREIPLYEDVNALKLVSVISFKEMFYLKTGEHCPETAPNIIDYASPKVKEFVLAYRWLTPSLLSDWSQRKEFAPLLPYRFRIVLPNGKGKNGNASK